MASDASKAAIGIARVLVALVVGGLIGYWIWYNIPEMQKTWAPWAQDWMAYLAGLLSALMAGLLISKQSKGT